MTCFIDYSVLSVISLEFHAARTTLIACKAIKVIKAIKVKAGCIYTVG
jgi:hypothetical protein